MNVPLCPLLITNTVSTCPSQKLHMKKKIHTFNKLVVRSIDFRRICDNDDYQKKKTHKQIEAKQKRPSFYEAA